MAPDTLPIVATPAPPEQSLWYLTGEDAVRLAVLNSAAGVTATLRGRFLPLRTNADEPTPRVQTFSFDLIPATNRTWSTVIRSLREGWILDWSVVVSAGTPNTGQTFARVEIVRGVASSALALSALGAGYVTANQPLFGPGGLAQGTLDGAGQLRVIVGTNPAAGVEVSETVPAGARWQLVSFSVVLVTAVAAANRVPTLIIDDGVNQFWQATSGNVQAASLTFTWEADTAPTASAAASSIQLWPIPNPIYLPAGGRLRTSTAALQAADDYAAPIYTVIERLEGN